MQSLVKFGALLVAGAIGAAALQGTAFALTPAFTPASASEESCLLGVLNAARAADGAAPLSVNADLVGVARAHSQQMASQGRLFHNPDLPNQAPSIWLSLGENVEPGPSCDDVARAFMAEPAHRVNILSRDFNYVGVGIVDTNGAIWVTEDFMEAPAGAGSAAPAPASSPSPKPAPAPKPVVVSPPRVVAPPPPPVSKPAAPPAPPVEAAPAPPTPATPLVEPDPSPSASADGGDGLLLTQASAMVEALGTPLTDAPAKPAAGRPKGHGFLHAIASFFCNSSSFPFFGGIAAPGAPGDSLRGGCYSPRIPLLPPRPPPTGPASFSAGSLVAVTRAGEAASPIGLAPGPSVLVRTRHGVMTS